MLPSTSGWLGKTKPTSVHHGKNLQLPWWKSCLEHHDQTSMPEKNCILDKSDQHWIRNGYLRFRLSFQLWQSSQSPKSGMRNNRWYRQLPFMTRAQLQVFNTKIVIQDAKFKQLTKSFNAQENTRAHKIYIEEDKLSQRYKKTRRAVFRLLHPSKIWRRLSFMGIGFTEVHQSYIYYKWTKSEIQCKQQKALTSRLGNLGNLFEWNLSPLLSITCQLILSLFSMGSNSVLNK